MRRIALFALLPLLGALAGGVGAYLLAGETSYQAETVFVVPATTGDSTVSRASEAFRLAQTLARLVPNDTAIVTGLSNAIGTTQDYARSNLSAVTQPETALVNVRFTAESRTTAVVAIEFLTRSLAPDPITDAIAPNTLVITREPNVAKIPGSSPATTGVGALVGLAAGLLVSTMLRRTRPVVTRNPATTEHEALAALPRTDLSLADSVKVQGLRARWDESIVFDSGWLVILLCAGSRLDEADLDELGQQEGMRHAVVVSRAENLPNLRFPGRERHCILVTTLGAPLSSVVDAAALAANFGCTPMWLLVAGTT